MPLAVVFRKPTRCKTVTARYPPETPPWQEAQAELAAVIGEVTLSVTAVENELDNVILDLMFLPPVYAFVRRRLLDRLGINGKVTLLRAFANERADAVSDARNALLILGDLSSVVEERNRLVHDLHLVSDDGDVSRRRLWEEDGRPVDLDAYRQLVDRLDALVEEGMPLLQDALSIGSFEDALVDAASALAGPDSSPSITGTSGPP